MIRFIDLFSGLGGFHVAAVNAGATCVFASEIDDELRRVYNDNFRLDPAGDIRQQKVDDIPKHDLLCAGFPCQPFSKAGDQRGFKDRIRGTLILQVLKIVQKHKPTFILLENVSHFINHNDGKSYLRLVKDLRKEGYEVSVKQLSPHHFGIPQIRDRMYLVARRGSLCGFTWPKTEHKSHSPSVKNILDQKPNDAKPLPEQLVVCLQNWQEFLNQFPKDQRLPGFPIWAMEFGASYPINRGSLHTLPLSILRDLSGSFGESLDFRWRKDILDRVPVYACTEIEAFPTWKQDFILKNRALYATHKDWIDGWSPKIREFAPSFQKLEWNCGSARRDIFENLIQFRASGIRIKLPTTTPSLVAMTTSQIPVIGWELRYMTVRECARLQSLDCLKHFPTGTKAFKALGNAVNVTVVSAILRNLLRLGIHKGRQSGKAA